MRILKKVLSISAKSATYGEEWCLQQIRKAKYCEKIRAAEADRLTALVKCFYAKMYSQKSG